MKPICVLFDMDGTLYDSEINLQSIRNQLSLPRNGLPILAQLQSTSPENRARGIELLHAAEAKGAANGHLIPGTRELLFWLKGHDVRCALITNNSRSSVETVLARHPLDLDLVLTREDAVSKPEPDLFLMALERLHIQPLNAVAVGDTHLDAVAAHRAGISEIHLVGLSDWRASLIPKEVAYKQAANLYDVRKRIEEWLQRYGIPGLV